MTASNMGSFEAQSGIEANDLASLLCMFEEATSSVTDENVEVWKKRNIMYVKNGKSRNISDVTLSVTASIQDSIMESKIQEDKAIHIVARSRTNSSSVCSDLNHMGSISTLSSDKSLMESVQFDETEIVDFSQYVMENWNNYLEKTSHEFGSSSALIPNIKTDTWDNKSLSEYNKHLLPVATNCVNSSYPLPPEDIFEEYSLPVTDGAQEDTDFHSLNQNFMQPFSLSQTSLLISETEVAHISPELEQQETVDVPVVNSNSDHTHHNHVNIEEGVEIRDSDHNYFIRNELQPNPKMHKSESTLSCSSSQQEKAEVPYIAEESSSEIIEEFIDIPCDLWATASSHSPDQVVVEKDEIFIDSGGNNLYTESASQPHEHVMHNYIGDEHITSCKKGNNRKTNKRQHGRSFQKLESSSICQDDRLLFDKIPSYYTALSIPAKPITTTVFATTAKVLGCTDHMDLIDSSELDEEGHYNKVPAHRCCFSNTAKDVEITFENQEVEKCSSIHLPNEDSFYKHSERKADNLSVPHNSLLKNNLNTASTIVEGHRKSRSPKRRNYHLHKRYSRSSSSSSSGSSSSSSSRISCCSSCGYSSECSTCSESRSRERSPLCTDFRRSRTSASPFRKRNRPSMEQRLSEKRKRREEEKIKAMEERRVVYVGKVPDGYSKQQLYDHFEKFGEIKEVKINFREHGDNYGFITFAHASDAVAAKEKGNSVHKSIKFDLCFGGRRHFCPDEYADLDGNQEIEEEYAPIPKNLTEELDYAALLKQHSTHQKRKRM